MIRSYVTVMTGDKPSIKKYKIIDGQLQKTTSEFGYNFDSETIPVNDIAELYQCIKKAGEDKRKFIIRGKGVYPRQFDVRRTKHNDFSSGNFTEAASQWLCIDFDEAISDIEDRLSTEAIDALIETRLPKEFHNVSYLYQWSASAGLEYNGKPIKRGTNVHIFFWLDRPIFWEDMKEWLKEELALFIKDHNLGVDPATLRTVTPIFVGYNVEKDDDIIDLIKGNRVGFVEKDTDEVVTPTQVSLNESRSKQQIQYDYYKFKGTNNTNSKEDLYDAILTGLSNVGCILSKTSNGFKLYHHNEKTKGDWFIYIKNPVYVRHHCREPINVWDWCKEFWNTELNVDKPKWLIKQQMEDNNNKEIEYTRRLIGGE